MGSPPVPFVDILVCVSASGSCTVNTWHVLTCSFSSGVTIKDQVRSFSLPITAGLQIGRFILIRDPVRFFFLRRSTSKPDPSIFLFKIQLAGPPPTPGSRTQPARYRHILFRARTELETILGFKRGSGSILPPLCPRSTARQPASRTQLAHLIMIRDA